MSFNFEVFCCAAAEDGHFFMDPIGITIRVFFSSNL